MPTQHPTERSGAVARNLSAESIADLPRPRRACQAQTPDTGPPPARIVIIHRLALLRVGVRSLLAALPRFRVCGEASAGNGACDLLARTDADAVVLGLTLDDSGDGVLLIRELLNLRPSSRIVVITQRLDALSCQRALRAGARGYVAAQDHASELPRALDEALAGRRYASPSCTQHLLEALASTGARKHSLDPLSDRELQVFRLLGTGVGTTRLAHQLHLSVKTVETHCMRIKTKLHIDSGAELKQRASLWLRQSELGET